MVAGVAGSNAVRSAVGKAAGASVSQLVSGGGGMGLAKAALGVDTVALSTAGRSIKPMAPAQLTLKAKGLLDKQQIQHADALKVLRSADRTFKRALIDGQSQTAALQMAAEKIAQKLPTDTPSDVVKAITNGLRPQYRSLKAKADDAIQAGRVTRQPTATPGATHAVQTITPAPGPQPIKTPQGGSTTKPVRTQAPAKPSPKPVKQPVTTTQAPIKVTGPASNTVSAPITPKTTLKGDLVALKDDFVHAIAASYAAGAVTRQFLQGDAQTLSGGISQHWKRAWQRHDVSYQNQFAKASNLAETVGRWINQSLPR
jgi:hypothetical protein